MPYLVHVMMRQMDDCSVRGWRSVVRDTSDPRKMDPPSTWRSLWAS